MYSRSDDTRTLLYGTIDNVYLHKITSTATPTHVRSAAAAKYIMDVEGEKVKRFRVHVVQELYQTERDYVEALEFTVNVRNRDSSRYVEVYYVFMLYCSKLVLHIHTYIYISFSGACICMYILCIDIERYIWT